MIQVARHFKNAILLALTLLGTASPIWPQANSIQYHLDSTYTGKRFLLRNFYVGDDLSYGRDGILRAGKNTPGPWTLAGVEITRIEARSNGLEIKAKRLGIYFHDEQQDFLTIGKVKIHIPTPISNDTVENVFDGTLDKIFIRLGEEDLRPLLPAHWKVCLSGKDLDSREAAWDTALSGSKVPFLKTKDFPTGQLTPPKVFFSPDPEYTDSARSQHVQGTSVLGVVVDTAGKPVAAAILRPLGMGLDEAALLAVSRWQFRPGVLNGTPAPVRITIEVGFKFF